MPDMSAKRILHSLSAMVLVCVVMTLLLSATNVLTKDRIEELAIEAENAARQSVFPTAEIFTEMDRPDLDAISIIEAESGNGTVIGYAITTAYRGYGGDVNVMTGIRVDGTIQSVRIMEEEETPGLGKKVREDRFLAPFLEKSATSVFTVRPDEVDLERVDAIAGATISSNAVAKAVNQACAVYLTLQGGES